MIDRYRRWFDYEKDSHAKTIASLNAVPAELREREAFPKAVLFDGPHCRSSAHVVISFWHAMSIKFQTKACGSESINL